MAVSERNRICRECGSEFSRLSKFQPLLYCNRACKLLANNRRNAARRTLHGAFRGKVPDEFRKPLRKRNPAHYFSCEQCGERFYRKLSKAQNGTIYRHCSLTCKLVHAEADSLRLIGERWRTSHSIHGKCRGCGCQIRLTRRKCDKCLAAMVEERKHGTCRNCKADFERLEKHQHFCCIECRAVSKRESRERFKTTDAYKSSRRASKKKSKTLRRVRQAIRAESIDPIKVFDRDGWRCHMCKQKTPKHLRGTYEDLAPELDHIITLADGGSHTWDNVACSCRQCNIRKGSKSFGQLRIAA